MGFSFAGGGVKKHTLLTDKEVNGVIDHALESVREPQMYNSEAWSKLLAAEVYKAGDIPKKKWTGTQCIALTYDGTYIYAGLFTSPATIVKIDPKTMTVVGSPWTGSIPAGFCYALTFDGTYIYACCIAAVYKINPKDMTTVGEWGEIFGIGGVSITCDRNYIYFAFPTTQAMVYKIKTSDMSLADVWIEPTADSLVSITFDGIYIYAGTAEIGVPAKVFKIDPVTMTTVVMAGNPLILPFGRCFSLAFDGTYIYAGENDVNARVAKIKPSDMSTVAIFPGFFGRDNCRSLVFDGTYIYAGLDNTIGIVIKIDTDTMTILSEWRTGLVTTENNCNVLIFDGKFIYAGVDTGVLRKIVKDIYETD
jgi:DNA-binding beta-propeller fold protein YncE